MKVLSLLPLLAVASCLPIYAVIVKINQDGVSSIKEYKDVNLDGIDSLAQLASSPNFKKPEDIEAALSKHEKNPHQRISGVKPCHGGPKHHKPKHHKDPKHDEAPESVVAGPFKSYEEVKEFTNNLISSKLEQINENDYLESTKVWANGLFQDVKDIDFKESFKNIASDDEALLSILAGFLSGFILYGIIYLVYLRKLSFDEKFEDYEAQIPSQEYNDEKLPLYKDEVSDDEE
ncbi:putative membrane protein [Wickerhamomyces ciferrii]|uniref:Membrane protein n=1 Tax=Wickerhamomyces ciferrii (strain ATCC 14091 / BCRC 22168 / CBS 111 / JCM 3599 / NBRC 0793 / NRRL Y-1031 F-60-10) TaxID=1206466 RepID=K0KZ28_WICCF|nr:uncharacterized protein BN7_5941 [Wickerhamomyces ciferrii]CCH46348.1 putative membrane protein [Wickerhamomyces ciferrii]